MSPSSWSIEDSAIAALGYGLTALKSPLGIPLYFLMVYLWWRFAYEGSGQKLLYDISRGMKAKREMQDKEEEKN